MRSLTFIIAGDPQALARPRFSSRSGRVNIYDSQKQEKLIHSIQLAQQMGDEPQFTGPLILSVDFYFPTGKSKRRNTTPHFFKPDLDNCIKWVCDISQSIIFPNDCLIYKIIASKFYDTNPRTTFTISQFIGDSNVRTQ